MKQILIASLIVALSQAATAQENPLIDGPSWADLREDFVGDTPLLVADDLFTVDAPYRAHDAATVPIVIAQSAGATPIDHAVVIIDENPAPMAADLTFGSAMHPLKFELRVRVNQYSNVRILADTAEGTFMKGRYVKASGGCSAPASRDPEVALASMGLMRLQQFDDPVQMSGQIRDAQIMIRHPNYSGLQRDQVTQLFIGAHFIDKLEVFQGDEMLFTMEGGISVSENPVFRFSYRENGAPAFHVRARDTEGNVFEETLQKNVES
ncbi:quinoprotein dehydrogenase-associated SoxYZ-like carrier [Yoonia sediminilitoris]|uniref:Sulfur-oxidizing protein SoxY n=1 Tax=Yoonia sediminilitoris TaxID=1286148 RepID=A0A2T6KSB2_9RHOB|nr:quinoprotein dehydrogenase-associated SoxYZ-like carrier [Yoonia sediminilitoris]PUB19438.1 sulfur-oxidizing protein SoxY [Yoonia sediminilitoris]RCW99606.1 sulfur-oxidizing protein SoxY [Yoonia sediminilitoris]